MALLLRVHGIEGFTVYESEWWGWGHLPTRMGGNIPDLECDLSKKLDTGPAEQL